MLQLQISIRLNASDSRWKMRWDQIRWETGWEDGGQPSSGLVESVPLFQLSSFNLESTNNVESNHFCPSHKPTQADSDPLSSCSSQTSPSPLPTSSLPSVLSTSSLASAHSLRSISTTPKKPQAAPAPAPTGSANDPIPLTSLANRQSNQQSLETPRNNVGE